MNTHKSHNMTKLLAGLACLAPAVSGCTKLLPNAFQLEQQLQAFNTNVQVNTKIDMLWVVDNSSSMDPSQQRLRNGFAAFAQKYMQPTWDIRVAAIPTDAYLAHPIYSNWLGSPIAGTSNIADPYIHPLVTGGHYTTPTNNASWNVSETNVVQMAAGPGQGNYAVGGVTINELVPAWGPNYSKLLSGIHDGPVAGLCGNLMSYFLHGENQCSIRDSRAQLGTANCLSPAAGQSSVTQCVNTVQNDTLHTNTPIINTMPPAGTPGDAAWVQSLVNNFIIDLTTGTAGMGSERGLGSVLQFINDNEAVGSLSAFFRPGSLRVIVFISDEDDQTMNYSAADLANASFSPWTHYQCDQAGLSALNAGTPGRYPASFCCTGGSCTYGTDGVSCPSKTIPNNDGTSYTYATSICANPTLLTPVATIKSRLDTFFSGLDGGGGASPNYFVVTITGLTGDSVRALQATHDVDDTAASAPVQVTADRADRYIALGNLVGNGSMSMDITSNDYTPILTAIGNAIIAKKGTFQLRLPTTGQQDMIVTVLHAGGSVSIVRNTQYSVSGTTLTITDLNLILSLASTDQINVDYQPSTSFVQ